MLTDYINHQKFMLFMGVMFVICVVVVVAILLDLWDGVYTARITGERVHSHKFRDTIYKMSEYWRFILIGFLIDCVGLLLACFSGWFDFYVVPFVAIVFGSGLILVEIKSMFEHARRRKSRTADIPSLLRKIINAKNIDEAREVLDRISGIVEPETESKNGRR